MAEVHSEREKVLLPEVEVEVAVADTLKAVAITAGVSEAEFVRGAVINLLRQVALDPGFSGEFADRCAEFDEQTGHTGESTHSQLAGSVMAFRASMR